MARIVIFQQCASTDKGRQFLRLSQNVGKEAAARAEVVLSAEQA